MTCAFDCPNFEANLESVPMASLGMRTLVATFSITLYYYVRKLSLTFASDGVVEAHEIAEAAKAWGQNDDITVVTVRRIVA